MKIIASHAVQEYIGKYYTNYNFAYVGKLFSEAFQKWNYDFIKDITSAFKSYSISYAGKVCILKTSFYRLSNGELLMYISSIVFDPIAVMQVFYQSHIERLQKGLPSTPPSLTSSTKRVTDYSYYNTGGTYNGHQIDIVKKKRSSKQKPQFNYYNRNTRSIMFNYDFFSAFPFENNEACAWATDGHKYRLPMMQLLENKRSVDRIISETINRFLKRELIA